MPRGFIPVLAFLLSCQTLWRQSSATDEKIDALHGEAKQAEASSDLATASQKYQEMLKLAPQLGPAYHKLDLPYTKQGRYYAQADRGHALLKLHHVTDAPPELTTARFPFRTPIGPYTRRIR